jgi:hypothetical protein
MHIHNACIHIYVYIYMCIYIYTYIYISIEDRFSFLICLMIIRILSETFSHSVQSIVLELARGLKTRNSHCVIILSLEILLGLTEKSREQTQAYSLIPSHCPLIAYIKHRGRTWILWRMSGEKRQSSDSSVLFLSHGSEEGICLLPPKQSKVLKDYKGLTDHGT